MKYVATGCDSNFVELTCGMLCSFEEKAGIDDAKIIVTAFDLSPADKDRLKLAAGVLGRDMRFLDVDRRSALVPRVPAFSFPFPMLGCLVAPKGVTDAGSRLLILDSDMIINGSLAPLFALDLMGHPMAAVKDMLVPAELHARGREWNEDYFNTGLLLIDVDAWTRRDLGNRAMAWLADQPSKPEWPDQDALNAIVGPDWLRLDRKWNFAYCGEGRQFTADEFGAAKIVHFSGAKPTEARNHPAVPLYDRQIERLHAKERWGQPDRHACDRDFVALTYEVLLGREIEDALLATRRSHQPASHVITDLLQSSEAGQVLIQPLRQGELLPKDRWPGKPTIRQRYTVADRFPVRPHTAALIERATSWRTLLAALVADDRFMAQANLDPITAVPALA